MTTKPVWDPLYKTARWQRLRWSTLVRDDFTCQMCGRVGAAPELVADHRKPHRGDEGLFWNADNLWTLCANPCHNRHKQSEEKGGKPKPAISLDGWPVEG